jgi:hypothetical protein
VELLAARCVPSAATTDPSPTTPVPTDASLSQPAPTAVIRTFPVQQSVNGSWVIDLATSPTVYEVVALGSQGASPLVTVIDVTGSEKAFAAPGPVTLAAEADVRQPGLPELWARRPPDAAPPGPAGLLLPQPAPVAAPEATPRTPAANPAPREPWSGAAEVWAAPRRPVDAVRSEPPARSDALRQVRGEIRPAAWHDPFPGRDPIDPSGLLWRAVWVGDPPPPRSVVHAVTQSQYEGGELRRPLPDVVPLAPAASPAASCLPPTPADEVGELLARFAAEPAGTVQYPADPTPPPTEPGPESWWLRSARLAGWAAAAWLAVRSFAASVRRSSPGERPDRDPSGALSDGGDRDGRLRVETIDGPFPR